MLVCPGHHRMIHEGALACEVRGGKIMFIDPRGRDIAYAPPSGATRHALEELELFLRGADVHIDPSINALEWDGTPMNLADSLGWMFIADQTRTKRACCARS